MTQSILPSFPDQSPQVLWDISSNPLLVINKDKVIIACNPAANAMLGQVMNTSFPAILVDPELVLPLLEECHTQQTQISAGLVTIQSLKSNPLKINLEFYPFGSDYLVCFKPADVPLDHLEEVVRNNDARVEKLSVQLKQVSSELLMKTLELAEEKKRLSTVMNGISEGLLGCDSHGHLIHYNETAQQLLHLSSEEMNNKPFNELCPQIAEAVGFYPGNLSQISSKRMDITFDSTIIQVIASPISDENKQTVGLVLILHDRTKEAELEQMKSDLISIVSHEMRSPLTSIKGYVDLMMGGDLGEIPSFIKNYLGIVSSNANRLAALIDDMLDLSRIESGKLSMSFGKIDINYLCDYVYLTMKPLAEKKEIHFSHEIQPNLAVSGDVDRLQQVLTNLVSNAIKYTLNGGEVSIKAFRKENIICISVYDTGIGINERDQKKLFHKFFRVKNVKTRNIGGTGLGLCIAQSIVEAHNGRITLQSEEDKGSCFTIELPDYHPDLIIR